MSGTGTDPTNQTILIPQMILFQDRYKYTSTVLNCQYVQTSLTVLAIKTLLRHVFSTWQAMQTCNSLQSFAQ